MKWFKTIIDSMFTPKIETVSKTLQNDSEEFNDINAPIYEKTEEQKLFSENFDSNSYSEIYDILKRYYDNKNNFYQQDIKYACAYHADETISENFIKDELKERSKHAQRLYAGELYTPSDDDDNYDGTTTDDLIKSNRNWVQFYKDLLRFKDYFLDKEINLTLKDILILFTKIKNSHSTTHQDELELKLHEKDINNDMIGHGIGENLEHDIKSSYYDYTYRDDPVDFMSNGEKSRKPINEDNAKILSEPFKEGATVSYSENFDSNSYSIIYDTFEKYYKAKNTDYQSAISLTCSSYSNESISDIKIENEISKFVALTNDPNVYDDDDDEINDSERMIHRDFAQFYKDLLRFKDYFQGKEINLTSNDVLMIFKDVNENIVENKREIVGDELFHIMQQRIGDECSKEHLIKEYYIYNLENVDRPTTAVRCYNNLPDLFSQFNFVYDYDQNELDSILLQIIEDLGLGFGPNEDDDTENGISGVLEFDIKSSYDDYTYGDDPVEPLFDSNDEISPFSNEPTRERKISSKTKREVWRRDQGKCTNCGSREKLEYDHIIPFSKGGSNTTRNIELLCQKCNRTKSDKIL